MLYGLTAAAPKYGGTPAYVKDGDGGAGIRRARSIGAGVRGDLLLGGLRYKRQF
jgi:hypothetical protein